MNAALLIAIAAAVGNLLQGWDNANMAGGVVYIKSEFKWENEPVMEGLILALSLIGATLITLCSGGISDWLGRRPMLIASSILYFVSGLLMLWSPNVYILIFARLLDGFGIGLAVTFVPLYISEMAPPEIRGLLSTLPQFTYSSGMFLSYCMVFGMSLKKSPSWRLMLGVLFIPSILYFALTTFYLPESPRWLVSKGRMLEARQVLRRLRGKEDVSDEMALLVEGLGVSDETTIEDYMIGPANKLTDEVEQSSNEEKIRLFGHEGLSTVVARPTPGQSILGVTSHQGSLLKQKAFSVTPIVTLFDSIHEKLSDTGSKGSMYLSHETGSMFNFAGNQLKNEEWDAESDTREEEDYVCGAALSEFDDNLQSPLLSRQTSLDNMIPPHSYGSSLNMRRGSSMQGTNAELCQSSVIGSGWQLAWKWKEGEGPDENREGSFKRVYMHENEQPGSWRGSLVSIQGTDGPPNGDFIKVAALVSQPALYTKELMDQHPVGPAMIHPSEATARSPHWKHLFDPGVKQALVVGIGIQILQQFLGINGVLYYAPQILEQVGVGILLSNMGINSVSASLFISAIMTMLMLPCVAISMRLMDVSGRRSLLLRTNPVLTISLSILVIANVANASSVAKATISTFSVVLYCCFFSMGFGPIPNILCAEIFPTRVRGICIAICALIYWACNIIVTYTLPLMLSSIGLAGIFSIYAVVSIISWGFVYLKVPETKGMPLEVITEFFSVGAKPIAGVKTLEHV